MSTSIARRIPNENERWHQNIISPIERSQKMLPIMQVKSTATHSSSKNIRDLVHFTTELSRDYHGTINPHICSRHNFWRRMIETKLQVRNRNRIEARFDWCNKKMASSPGQKRNRTSNTKSDVLIVPLITVLKLVVDLDDHRRVCLRHVDLSKTPSGAFCRRVHPGSEMAGQNDQNGCFGQNVQNDPKGPGFL